MVLKVLKTLEVTQRSTQFEYVMFIVVAQSTEID